MNWPRRAISDALTKEVISTLSSGTMVTTASRPSRIYDTIIKILSLLVTFFIAYQIPSCPIFLATKLEPSTITSATTDLNTLTAVE